MLSDSFAEFNEESQLLIVKLGYNQAFFFDRHKLHDKVMYKFT